MDNQAIWYDKERLLQDADMEQVADYIKALTKIMGSNISLLCQNPEHDDHNLGNCFITKDGKECICYACGHRSDVIDFVKNHESVGYIEALGIIGDACGGREKYQISAPMAGQDFQRVLNKTECERIGIHNARVYGAVRLSYESRTLQPGERAVLSHWDRNDEPVYCIERCLESNPLLKLMQEDFSAYRELIVGKAEEQIEDLQEMMAAFASGRDGVELLEEFCHQIAQVEDVLLSHFRDETTVKKVMEWSRALKRRKSEVLAGLAASRAAASF